MGKYNKEKQPQTKLKFKRFCSVCKKVSYEWECCGQKTRRFNIQPTIGSKIVQLGQKV